MMRGDDKEARMANAMAVVAGRAARPCDVCARKRSRWYCAADEAYLCEGCDSSVHAANALALRHERVRLAPNGAPMKINRRINSTDNPSGEPKKKLKSGQSAPSSRTNATAAYHNKYLSDPTHLNANGHVREVKKESNSGFNSNTEIDPSDDHFTAEELTGNANLLDDTPSMPPHHHSSSSHPGSNVISEGDFARFLVSDPNDPNNCTNWEGDDDRIKGGTPTGSAGEGDVVDDEDLDDGDVGDDWMELDPNFSYRDSTLSDSSDYCIDHVALRGSASAAGAGGAFDPSLAVYSHDEKPDDAGSCGLPTASSKMGKPFKNIAAHSEWVKQEEGYPSYEQTLSTNTSSITTTNTSSACKIELSESEIKQLPSLKLNFDDVLISWQDRDIHWSDDGSSQLVPGDNSNSDAMGSCYDLGLVPDLSSAGYGVDAQGHPTAMYGGCCPGSMGAGGGLAGEDSIANAGNAREVRVNRYREKRRTRLFSKKIRYEVRKLNAERRPRMKGRFVKRSPGRET